MKLEIKDLTVEVENKIILDHFNLEIEPGTIHAVMGPNGVGKSTLSRVIMGDSHYQVLNGDIFFEDESILKLPVDERSRKGIFLAKQSPMEIDGVTNQDFLRTAISQKNQERVGLYQFIQDCEKATEELGMQEANKIAIELDKSDNVEKEVTLIKADNTSFLEKLIEKFIIK